MVGLTDLIEGAACLYLGDTEAAIKSFRNCLKCRYPSKDEYDQHVSAFALYELGSSLSNNNVSISQTHRLYFCLCICISYFIVSYFRILMKAKISYQKRKLSTKITTLKLDSICVYMPP